MDVLALQTEMSMYLFHDRTYPYKDKVDEEILSEVFEDEYSHIVEPIINND